MNRIKLFGLALAALCVVALSASAMASAAPVEMLPSATQNFTGKNVGNTELETLAGTKVTCTAAKGEGKAEKSGGTFKITFESCTSSGFSCGNIATEGTEKYTKDTSGSNYALLFTLGKAVKFTCAGFVSIEVLANGQVLCLVLEPTSSKTTHEFHCIANAGGNDPSETKYRLEEGEAEKTITSLLTKVNGGTAESSVQKGLGTFTVGTAIAFMN